MQAVWGRCRAMLKSHPSKKESDLEKQLNIQLQRIQQEIELEALQHQQRMKYYKHFRLVNYIQLYLNKILLADFTQECVYPPSKGIDSTNCNQLQNCYFAGRSASQLYYTTGIVGTIQVLWVKQILQLQVLWVLQIAIPWVLCWYCRYVYH